MKILKRFTYSRLLFNRAWMSTAIWRIAVIRHFHRQSANLFHVSYPAGLHAVPIFFLNELPKEEALRILEEYKEQCMKEKDSLMDANETVQTFKDIYSVNKKDHIFWQLTVKHGELCYEACLKWADYAIEVIKNKL